MKEIILKPEDIKEYDENDPDTFGDLIKKTSKLYMEFREEMYRNYMKKVIEEYEGRSKNK